MPQFNNAMEVFKLLEKSNCRACNEKTCLAFASAVYLGKKELNECPHLDTEIIAGNDGETKKGQTLANEQEKALKALQEKLKSVDLSSVAERVDGVFADNRLIICHFLEIQFAPLPEQSVPCLSVFQLPECYPLTGHRLFFAV